MLRNKILLMSLRDYHVVGKAEIELACSKRYNRCPHHGHTNPECLVQLKESTDRKGRMES